MRERDMSYTEQAYDDTVCFQCEAKLPEVTDNELKSEAQYFAFEGGFCDAHCAALHLSKHPNGNGFTPEFMRRIAVAVSERNTLRDALHITAGSWESAHALRNEVEALRKALRDDAFVMTCRALVALSESPGIVTTGKPLAQVVEQARAALLKVAA